MITTAHLSDLLCSSIYIIHHDDQVDRNISNVPSSASNLHKENGIMSTNKLFIDNSYYMYVILSIV